MIEGILQCEGAIDVIVRRAWPFSVLEGDGTDQHLDDTARAIPAHNFR